MREILFRGKRTDNGEWVYGDLLQRDEGRKIKAIMPPYPAKKGIVVKEDSIGQYTGLTDKNGTQIFEGDIFIDKEDEVISVVKFRNGMFCLVDYGIKGALMPYGYDESAGGFGECDCQPMDNYNIDEMQIDGNIHDNPELLKEV